MNPACVDAERGGTNIADLYDGDGVYQGNPVSGIPDKMEDDGVITKLTLSYTPSTDVLLYAPLSEGYRAGFLNRPGGASTPDGSYTVPYGFETDEMTNAEIGWKTDLMDGRMRLNGSAFFAQIDGCLLYTSPSPRDSV